MELHTINASIQICGPYLSNTVTEINLKISSYEYEDLKIN